MSDSMDCDPMDCNLPGSSVLGIFHTRILEWLAISFSRESSQPRDRTRSLASQTGALTSEPPGTPLFNKYRGINLAKELKDLHAENYKILMKEIKND